MKKDQLIKLLVAIGISSANAEIMANVDESAVIAETEIETIVNGFKASQLELAKNNPDIVKPIQDAEKAKQLDIVERKIKQTFGLNPEEIKDKKFEELITIAKSKAVTSGNQTTEDLQKEIMRLEGELKNVKEVEIPAIRSEVDGHIEGFNYEQTLTKMVSSFELRNPIGAVLPSVKNFLKDNYDIKKNDKGEYVVFQKGTELRAKTTDGNGFIELKDVLKINMETSGFLKESNGGAGGPKLGPDGKPLTIQAEIKEDAKPKNNLHLSVAEQHVQNLKDLALKNA